MLEREFRPTLTYYYPCRGRTHDANVSFVLIFGICAQYATFWVLLFLNLKTLQICVCYIFSNAYLREKQRSEILLRQFFRIRTLRANLEGKGSENRGGGVL